MKILKYITVCSIVFLLFLMVALCLHLTRPYLFGNHDKLYNAKTANWLPQEATNVFSYNVGVFECYEFSISEKGFLDWARIKGLSVMEIEGTAEIQRYEYFANNVLAPEKDAPISELEKYIGLQKAVAKNGYYSNEMSKSGSGYIVMYDREKGRAYYIWSLR